MFGQERRPQKEKHMIRTNVWIKLLTTVFLTAVTSFVQSSDRLPVTDAEKIADASRAGPAFITKDATLLDWSSAPPESNKWIARADDRIGKSAARSRTQAKTIIRQVVENMIGTEEIRLPVD
jgi:hypothetical protein